MSSRCIGSQPPSGGNIVKNGTINFTVKEIDGAFGKGRMFKAEEWDENGPKFDTGDPALTEKPITD